MILSILGAMSMQASNEIYAVLSSNGTELTLYYDGQREARKGVTDWTVYNSEKDKESKVSMIVLDASMKDARPTSTSNWFHGFSKLEEIEHIDYLNTSEVTDMSNMFSSSFRLTHLDLRTFNVEKVTDMSNLFSACTNLTDLKIGSWKTISATDMSGMFASCSLLRHVDLSHFSTYYVENMSMMFFDSGFTSLDLTNFQTYNVTKMLMMFAGCTNLQKIYTQFNWDEGKVTKETSMLMFASCTSLTGEHGTMYDQSHTDIEYARLDGTDKKQGYFSFRPKLYRALENGNEVHFYYDQWQDYRTKFDPDKSKQDIVKVVFHEAVKNAQVTSTAKLFEGFINLEEIVNFDYLSMEFVEDMSYMFADCAKLKTIDLSHFTTDNVTTMSHMFSGCTSLGSLDLCGFEMNEVADTRSMFEGCSSLKTIYCNMNWGKKLTLKESGSMFLGCTSLTNGTTSYNASKVDKAYARPGSGYFTEKDEIFGVIGASKEQFILYYNKLRDGMQGIAHWESKRYPLVHEIVLDASMKDARPTNTRYWFAPFANARKIRKLDYLNTSEVTDMSYMFDYCRNVTSLDVSGFDMSKVSNTSHMFEGCRILKTIYCKADWSQSEVLTKSENMFFHCLDLIGGFSTKFSEEHIDKEYARLDHGDDLKGYFTAPAEVYGVLSSDKKTVTLYYDSKCMHNGGSTNWLADFKQHEVTKIVLDKSMVSMAPKDLSYMFFELKDLKSIEGLEYLNTSICTNMQFMFAGCSSLKKIDITGFNIKNLTNTFGMFANCSQLERIYCNDDWSASEKLTDSQGMFQGCTALVGSDGTTYDANHTDKEYARLGSGSKPGYFHAPPTVYGATSSDGTVFTLYCDDAIVERGGKTDWMEDIHGSVKTIIIDPSMAKARPTGTKDWFSDFTAANRIEGLEYLNTSEVTDMRRMFAYCYKLEWLNLNSFSKAKLTDFSEMFYECKNLERIYCDQDWTNVVGQFPFYGCVKLEGNVSGAKCKGDATDTSNGYAKVGDSEHPGYFSRFVDEPEIYALLSEDEKTLTIQYDNMRRPNYGVTDWSVYNSAKGYQVETIILDPSIAEVKPTSTALWFNYFQQVTEISGLSYLNTSDVTDMHSMFSSCEALKTLNLTNFNTSNVTNMNMMFGNCTALTELDISAFLTPNVTDMSMMFSGCSSLTELNVTNLDTHNVTEMNFMFMGCSALKTIYCTNDWSKSEALTGSMFMFFGCEQLAGGKSMVYDEEKIDATYACPDGSEGKQGYFSFPQSITYFVVSFEDYDGTLIVEMNVILGQSATPPPTPIHYGYNFTGWDRKFDNVTEDITVKAQYEKKSYHVRFVDWNEALLKEEDVLYEESATPPPDPQRDGYTFIGWDMDYTYITTDLKIMALYEVTKYTVNFVDMNGEPIGDPQKVEEGKAAVAPEAPVVEGYTFTGWDPADFSNVTEDMTIKAQYTINTYTVTLIAENGTISVLPEETDLTAVPHGTTLTLTATPDERYVFSEWTNYDPEKGLIVTSDTTVTASFAVKKYIVTFVDWNGTIISTQSVEHGADATAPDDPTREGYTFTGWSGSFTNVTSDLVLIAQYKQNPGTGIDQTPTTNDQLPMTNKVIKDGRLFILVGDRIYDSTGRLVQ